MDSMSELHTQSIRVFLIDDHRSILWGLQRLIESGRPAIQFVGSAESCEEAVKVLHDAAPHVILLDIDLGKENGIEEISKLISNSSAKILMLTGVRDKSAHDRAVLAGACGVVEKEASAETILTAISKVHEGQIWLDREATGRIFVEFSRDGNNKVADPEKVKIASLTQRERAIVAITANNAGANAKTIAQKLYISEHTLRNHLTSIYNKLEVSNRLELFAYAHKHGLTGPPS